MSDNIKTIKFNVTEAEIAKLRDEFNPASLPEKVDKGTDAYQQIHQAVMRLTSIRSGIETRRKELKKDAIEWGRKVDKQARELTEQVEKIEAPWKDLKAEADDRKKREEEEARRLEQARVERLEAKVLALQRATEGLLNASSEQIKSRLDKVINLSIQEDEYEEFYEAAVHHQQQAQAALQQALDAKLHQEAQAEELRKQREKFEAEQREFQRQQAEKLAADQPALAEDAKPAEDSRPAADEPTVDEPTVDIAPDMVEQAAVEPDAEQVEFEGWWKSAGVKIGRIGGESIDLWILRVAFAAWKSGARSARSRS